MSIISLFVLLTAVALPTINASSVVLLRTTSIIILTSAILFINVLNSSALGSGVILYNELLQVTSTGIFIDVLMLVAGCIAITPWIINNTNIAITAVFRENTYLLFVLFTLTGGIFLVSSADLVTIYLAIEIQSFSVYVIASVLNRDSEKSTHSSLLYFMLGGLSSSIILLGSAILYQYTGNTSINSIIIILSSGDFNFTTYNPISLGLVLITIGFLFKITAAPFHNWGPDVYDGVPTIAATWLAVVPKISILGLLLELRSGLGNLSSLWVSLILITAFLSLVVGTVVGLAQVRIKRLLAYSTISHVGFLLLTLSVNSQEAVESYLFYLLQYTATALNSFLIILAIGYMQRKISDNTYDINLISQLSGIFNNNPLLGTSFAVCLFSMSGIPPLAGFFGKLGVLYSALHAGYVFMAIIAIVVSVVSASYYLRVVRIIIFEKNNDPTNIIQISSVHSYIISLITSMLVFFMISSDIILNSVSILALALFNS